MSTRIINVQARLIQSIQEMEGVNSVQVEGEEIHVYFEAPVGGKPRLLKIKMEEQEVDELPVSGWVQAPLFGIR